MLAILSSPEATGRYAACMSLVMVANPLLIGLDNFLSPQAIHVFHAKGIAGLRRLTLRAALLITAIVMRPGCDFATCWRQVIGVALRSPTGRQRTDYFDRRVWFVAEWFFHERRKRAGRTQSACGNLLGESRRFSGHVRFRAGMIGTYGVLGAAVAALAGTFVATLLKSRVFVFMHQKVSGEPSNHNSAISSVIDNAILDSSIVNDAAVQPSLPN